MYAPKFHCLSCVLLFAAAVSVRAQITINGVTDKTNYYDSVTFTIVTQSGFTDAAFLNATPVAAGVAITVNQPDYYELAVRRTDNATSAVTTRLVRFIVAASERADTEWGLPPQTPWPVIQSSANEFSDAHLRILAPQDFPSGYPIPVVAWVVGDDGHAVRANGQLKAAGHPSIQIKRGVGSGFLSSSNPPGLLTYSADIAGLSTNKTINLEAAPTWTTVSGVLGNTTWPAGSRIHVTGGLTVPASVTLTVGAGTIVRFNGGLDITNNGSVVINGTVDQPVVFMPAVAGAPWGGFISKSSGAGTVTGTGVIFTGSGANSGWFGSGGNPTSHRSEQALFYCDGGQQISLTDAAAIFLAGQLGHSRNPSVVTPVTLTRFLMQHTTSGGEFTGAHFTVNDSAFIECPDDTANFVDGDNDALYFVDGTHSFTNTLIGWTKDDGIDSGGSGYGKLDYQSCWFEATFHEGNSLSGYKNTYARDTVYIDCGQGIEDGYNAPTGRVDHCLFLANQVGVRHGDNYDGGNGNYDGRLSATNCLVLYNHRDVFGYNWHSGAGNGWTQAVGQMFIANNLLTTTDTNYPNNSVWDPSVDAGRLAPFGGVGHVGIALAARAGQTSLASFPDGVPVGLSGFCTNEVTVDYSIDGTDGTSASGTLVFPPGKTHDFIPLPGAFTGVLRVALARPVNADLTGSSELLFQSLPAATATVLSPLGASWRYLDDGSDQGTAWFAFAFPDGSWSNGVARLGFGPDAAATTTIRRTNLLGVIRTFYFRRAVVVTNPAAFATIQFRYQRDDGCIVYLNGLEAFTNNMPPPPINYQTLASATISPQSETLRFWTNTLPATRLQPGTNLIAVEVHQATATSSDIAWDMELQGLPAALPPRLYIFRLGDTAILYWGDASYTLEQSLELNLSPAWVPVGNSSPVSVNLIDSHRYFRLRK